MAIAKNPEPEKTEPEDLRRCAPGFYVGDNGPYLTAEDAQAYIDGHLEGKGEVETVA